MKELHSNCWYEQVCNNDLCILDDLGHCTKKHVCPRFLEMSYMMENSNIPPAKQKPLQLIPEKIDYDTFCKLSDVKDNIVDYVERGQNVLICSQFAGNGKTSWSLKLLMKYFDSVWYGNDFKVRGLFIHVPTFLLKYKEFNNEDTEFVALKKLIPKVDIVVWDDFGCDTATKYDLSLLTMYVDQRILSEKCNIITTNLTSEKEFEELVGSRLTSRIWNTSETFELRGHDRRQINGITANNK